MPPLDNNWLVNLVNSNSRSFQTKCSGKTLRASRFKQDPTSFQIRNRSFWPASWSRSSISRPFLVGDQRPDSLDAYDLYLRALPCAVVAMPEDADKALPLLDKAIDLEPDFAAAHAMIAWCHEQRYLRGGMQEETRNAALHHARQAIAAGGDDAAALATAPTITALTAFDRSFALSSSSALALGFGSIVRAWKGDDAIAVEQANRALRLSPVDPWIYMPYIGLAYAHFAAGRFEETVAAASLATQANPRFIVPIVLHAAGLGCLDRSEDAKTVVQRLLELQPGLTVGTAILSARYVNPENIAALANALRRAGLPET